MTDHGPATRGGGEHTSVADHPSLLYLAHQADLEPWALLRAVRDPAGRVVDFVYHDINPVAARQQQSRREDLIGRSVTETLPTVRASGLLAKYAHCVDTGEPLVLDAFAYHGRALPDAMPDPAVRPDRRYDLRGARVPPDFLSLNWRDVTDRAEALAAAEQARNLLRISSDALLDPQVLLEVSHTPGQPTNLVFREVNAAFCDYLGKPRTEVIGHSLTELFPGVVDVGVLTQYLDSALLSGKPVVADDFAYYNEVFGQTRRYDIRGRRAGPGLLSLTFRDVTERHQNTARLAQSEERYRLLAANAGDVVASFRDGAIVWISPSVEKALGAPPAHWVGREVAKLIPAEDLPIFAELLDATAHGESAVRRLRVYAADGSPHWIDIHATTFYGADGVADGRIASFRVVDAEVAAQDQFRRYQRIIETSPVATVVHTLAGAVVAVNAAMCALFGVDAENLLQADWQSMTPEESLEGNRRAIEDLKAGWVDSHRDTQRFFRADGRPFWVDVTVSCLRDPDGNPEYVYAQMLDITDRIEAQQRLQSELDSAADFLRGILPGDLTGPVRVSSRYRSSREVGGDCYDYAWIDDDHLAVYLLDVSGHGVQSAMVAVSVLEGLRARSTSAEMLLTPDRVLTELNARFGMEDHNEHYLTIFYGVYERSTRTLTYAGAGHPPALVLGGAEPVLLASQSPPLGMFADTGFTSQRYRVPAGAQILLYSDGIYEFSRPDGSHLISKDFAEWCVAAASTPGWSLDSLIAEMQILSATGEFDDDYSLVLLSVD